jgi:hypothetical protein
MIFIQVFFALAITLFVYALPADTKPYLNDYASLSNRVSLDTTADKFQGAIQKQTDIPILDIGALVFYSGNIILDLFMNFIFALPEMGALLIKTIATLLSLDSFFTTRIMIFITVIFSVTYLMALFSFINGIRSGSAVV